MNILQKQMIEAKKSLGSYVVELQFTGLITKFSSKIYPVSYFLITNEWLIMATNF